MQQSSIHPALAEALAARGYDTLTSVQTAAAAEEAEGRDLIVSAKTGSGKTVAFGLAIAGQRQLVGKRLGKPIRQRLSKNAAKRRARRVALCLAEPAGRMVGQEVDADRLPMPPIG